MKIGDRVKVKEDCKFVFWVGKKGVITKTDRFRKCKFCVQFYVNNREGWFCENELELAEDSL